MSFKSAIEFLSTQQGKNKKVRFSKEEDQVVYTWPGYKKNKYRKPTVGEMENPKSMVHSKVRVMWRFMSGRPSEWFKGTIDTYNKDMKKLHVTYDDGTKRWYYITSNINGVPVLLENEPIVKVCSANIGKAIQLTDYKEDRDDSKIYDRRHDGAKSKYTKNKKKILDNIYAKNPEMWHKITNKSNEKINKKQVHTKKILHSQRMSALRRSWSEFKRVADTDKEHGI